MLPDIARYLNVRYAYFPSFARNGRRVAFLSNITGLPQVWSVPFDPEPTAPPYWPDQLTFHQERVQGVWHSPATRDDRLVYAMDTAGNEVAQLFLLAADGSQERPLTQNRPDAIHSFAAWHPAGTHIAFAANRRDPSLFDLYVQELESGEIRLVWQNDQPGFLVYGSFSPDGQRLLFTRVRSNREHDLFQVNLSSGQATLLSPEPGCYDRPTYSPDGQQVYVISNAGRDLRGVACIELASGHMTYIYTPDHEVEHLALTPAGRYLILATNVDGTHHLARLELTTSSLLPGPVLPAGVIGSFGDGLAISPNGRWVAFAYSHSVRTFDLMLWDLATNRCKAVTHSAHGGLRPENFVSPVLIRYPTFDGRQIPAWYYRPSGHKPPLPAVIWVHGGPESQYQPYFNPIVQYFVACGYAVLAPNVRGSSGYGRTYMDLDNVEKRMDAVADLAHAAYWLGSQPEVDSQRIAVYGGSYGGFMVLAALTHYPDLWAAGVDIVGISNLVTFLENTSSYRRAHREAEYGSLERDREFLESISPANHLDKIQAPLMVIHGANDPRVPVSESEQIVANLRQRGVPVEYLVFPDEGHGIVKLANKLVAYPRIAAFLAQHLRHS